MAWSSTMRFLRAAPSKARPLLSLWRAPAPASKLSIWRRTPCRFVHPRHRPGWSACTRWRRCARPPTRRPAGCRRGVASSQIALVALTRTSYVVCRMPHPWGPLNSGPGVAWSQFKAKLQLLLPQACAGYSNNALPGRTTSSH